MRILTTERQVRVRQSAGALGAAVAVALGLCAAQAQAQEVSRSPFVQVAMLTGAMVPTTFTTTALPRASIYDADVAIPAPLATQLPQGDAQDVAATNDESAEAASSAPAVTGMPLAAARVDDEQLGNQRGRNMGGTMVKSPGMALANGVTLWDELPGAVTPMPRPQQLSNGVNNVQVTRVTYTTR